MYYSGYNSLFTPTILQETETPLLQLYKLLLTVNRPLKVA